MLENAPVWVFLYGGAGVGQRKVCLTKYVFFYSFSASVKKYLF